MCARIPSPYILTNGIQLYTGRVLSTHDTWQTAVRRQLPRSTNQSSPTQCSCVHDV